MILVTGGSGFLGSHLLMELCKKGETVRALKRPSSDIAFLDKLFAFYDQTNLLKCIEWIDGDLNDIAAMENAMLGISQVYHCAAMVSFSSENKNLMQRSNINGTANLINAAQQAGVKKLCHVSSIGTLGKDDLISEKTPWDQQSKHSVYSLSKYKSELEAWRAMAEGLDTIIVHPSVILGPWKPDTGFASLFRSIEKGMKYAPGGANAFVDVRDVAKTMVMLMDSDLKNDNFIISSENMSYHDLMNIIARLKGVKPPTKQAPRFLTEIAWRISSLKSFTSKSAPALTRDLARITQNTSAYSNQKIREALKFDFIPVAESLADVNRFYQVSN
jgi:dihydroflavonol-4-reductase